ncbi:LysR family transcriptional regulator [Acetobacter sacchari]|uniref:LysR family transcriptional regulator n=1 Tax=Acetobacter sacchari TaxID=2661687 RepID=A0ABS3LQN3_9PROT|nr:LysR family transcriptional regulator [Acetobacter sacchari]MBO1358212.1 LysR family transcriptional regulator [Acetobacter sacchari]
MQKANDFPDVRRFLKLRHITLLHALDTTRSMKAAALRLGVSTAAVSKSCIEIEELLGAKLFRRLGGALEPTELCARVLTACRRIDAELIALNEDIVHMGKSLRGTVSIGFQAPALHTRLPNWCATVKREHPYLTLRCEYGMRATLLSELEANRLDMLLIDLHEIDVHPRFACEPLTTEFCVVVDKDANLRFSDVLRRWPEFVSRIWVLPVHGMAMRGRFDSLLKSRGLALPRRIIEVNSPIAAAEIGAAAEALMFVPASMLTHPHNLAVTLDDAFFQSEMFMTMGVAWLSDTRMTPSARFVFDAILADRPMEALQS